MGRKMLSRISNFWGGKFGVESAISILEFGGGGGKFGVENAISKFLIWEGGKFGVENVSGISNLGGGKFGAENTISNLHFLGWKIWGGKCYLES